LNIGRHLLPHEFDLLVDEEVGFGIPPLWAHVRDCSQCAAELSAARAAVEQIEQLPHLRPSPLFTERVMSQVHVFRPWYATALDIARRLVPQAGPLRAAVATAAALAAVSLTGAAFWAATRIDSFLLLLGILAQQLRVVTLEIAGSLFGSAAVAALEAGGGRTAGVAAFVLLVSAAVGWAWIARAARTVRQRAR
jgi:hypothetical protein